MQSFPARLSVWRMPRQEPQEARARTGGFNEGSPLAYAQVNGWG